MYLDEAVEFLDRNGWCIRFSNKYGPMTCYLHRCEDDYAEWPNRPFDLVLFALDVAFDTMKA